MAAAKGPSHSQTRKFYPTKIMGTLIVLTIFDFIFIFTEIRVWGDNDPKNSVWNSLKPMHGFGVFCFIVINLLKIVLMVVVGRGISEGNSAIQPR